MSAYGGLASILERLRVGIVLTMPEINNDVTMGVAKVIPGETHAYLSVPGYCSNSNIMTHFGSRFWLLCSACLDDWPRHFFSS